MNFSLNVLKRRVSTEFLLYRFQNVYFTRTLFRGVPKRNTSFHKNSTKTDISSIYKLEQNFLFFSH